MDEKKNTSNTPYDDVYRTLLNDCSTLIIPIVNEAFKRNHSKTEKIILRNNELFITEQNGKQQKIITDTNFTLGTIRYHLECQSTEDGTMLLRVFEYDSQLALQDSKIAEHTLTVHFPHTALLYLRHNRNTPDYMNVKIVVDGDCCSYKIPVMKVMNYNVDDIFEKELYFLIPFYIFTHEHNFKSYDSDKTKLQELLKVYEEMLVRLNRCVKEHKLTEYAKHTIIDMSKKVLEQIAAKYSNVKEGVGDLMGGKILNYEAKDILNAGRAEGRVTELVENILDFLAELGDVPEKLKETILAERDMDVLKRWLKLSAKSQSIEEFQEKM